MQTVGLIEPSELVFTDNDSFDISGDTDDVISQDVSTGVSGGTEPYVFSATGLPTGLTISEEGVISGTVATATDTTATITVTDANNNTANIEIAIEITAA